jgi:chemotaxis signal transduction protein
VSGSAAEDRAAGLRDAFDSSFSRAPAARAAASENLLTIRIGADRYALRLVSLAGLFAGKRIIWVPSPVPELLGIAGFRGTVRPVYDLAMLLGHPKGASPRWIAVAAPQAVGLAFDGFDSFVSAAPESVVTRPRGGADATQLHVDAFLEAGGTYPIVDIASVLARIARKTARDGGT